MTNLLIIAAILALYPIGCFISFRWGRYEERAAQEQAAHNRSRPQPSTWWNRERMNLN